jgi:hypothetical protein
MKLWFLERCGLFFLPWRNSPSGPRPPHCRRFMITPRHTTLGRTSPSQRPLPDNTQLSQQTDIHASDGIRTYSPNKRAAADPRLIPSGHWDRCWTELVSCYYLSDWLIFAGNGPLYSCFSSFITKFFFTCPCLQYPVLPVMVSRPPSYLIHQSFYRSSLTSCFLWIPLENYPWQSISWHSI